MCIWNKVLVVLQSEQRWSQKKNRERRLRWLGHVIRMDDCGMPNQTLNFYCVKFFVDSMVLFVQLYEVVVCCVNAEVQCSGVDMWLSVV